MKNHRKAKIIGTGKYLPKREVTAEELAFQLDISKEWIIKKSGVEKRHFASREETASKMGALAAKRALKDAGLELKDIDAIVATCGTHEVLLPSMATLIHKELDCNDLNIPAFDIGSTCLSFITGIDLISHMINAGQYKNVLIISAEVASLFLDWKHLESATLFGDGAAAAILGPSVDDDTSGIIGSHMATYSDCNEYCTITGGGSRLPACERTKENANNFLFQMDGKKVFRKISKVIEPFLDKLYQDTGINQDDIALFIPHQASLMAMRILKKKLNIEDKWLQIIEDHGNVVAASIPMALHEAIKTKRMQRGDKVMLLGSSAGLALGAVILEY